MGSGTTGKAALKEGRLFIGIEMKLANFEIAKARLFNIVSTTNNNDKVINNGELKYD
jgi:DNA modification methylase